MQTVEDLPTPALLVDLDKLEANIETMQDRATALGVWLRPHVKTHKCVEIARLQEAAGTRGITVSTLFEAEAFAAAGFDDITWAFPLILGRVEQVAALAARIRLGVVVDSEVAVQALAAARVPCRVWLKVDCGYHRAGVDPDSEAPFAVVTAMSAAGLELAGLLSHSGDAYDETTAEGRSAVAERERERITRLAVRLRDRGFVVPEVSVGSTPAMTAALDLSGVTEARPGNYAFFDLMQVRIGSCEVTECALTVLASVVSCGDSHSVIDAGALALSKDPGLPPTTMGEVFTNYEEGVLDDRLRLASLSQEHGKMTAPLPVGTRVRVLPNHSCLTVACFGDCYAVRGNDVVDRWRVWNGR